MFVSQEHCLSYLKRVFCLLVTSYMTRRASESETLSPEALDDFGKSYKAALTVGSITSRCSGNEPALLPRTHGWTRQFPFVGFNQSEQCPQNFVGHKLSRQFGLRPVMADVVELINGIREIFREKFKNSQRETLERFANGQDLFILQPTN